VRYRGPDEAFKVRVIGQPVQQVPEVRVIGQPVQQVPATSAGAEHRRAWRPGRPAAARVQVCPGRERGQHPPVPAGLDRCQGSLGLGRRVFTPAPPADRAARPDQPQRVALGIEAFDADLTLGLGQLEETGEIEAAMGAGPAAGLKREPLEAGRLVVGDPQVGTLANDRGQSQVRRTV
jgi:hypothetical protein